jgi:hypothetical protein
VAGQALRLGRRLLLVLVPVALLAALGAGALAWRLAQGPFPVPMLMRHIEAAANDGAAGFRLEIEAASIAWEGWNSGAAAPLYIRLERVRLRDAEGDLRADLPEVAVTLSPQGLLRGRLLPATIELRRPTLFLSREVDGSVRLGAIAAPGDGTAAPEAPPTDIGADVEATPLGRLLAALTGEDAARDGSALAGLRRLLIQGGTVRISDRQHGRSYALAGTMLSLRREAGGRLEGEGAAVLEAAGAAAPIRLTAAALPGAEPKLSLSLALPALRPAELGALWPGLVPLGAFDARVAIAASAVLHASGRPERIQATLTAEEGALQLSPELRLPFSGLTVGVEGSGDSYLLTTATLRLPGRGARTVHARGRASRTEDGWVAEAGLDLPDLALVELQEIWPEELVPELRSPILTALQDGLLRDGRLWARLRADSQLAAVKLDAAQVDLALQAVTLRLGGALALALPEVFAPGTEGAKAIAPETRLLADRIELAATAGPDAIVLSHLMVRLPAPDRTTPDRNTAGRVPDRTPERALDEAPAGARDGAPRGPALRMRGEATRAAAETGFRGALTLELDTVRFADLPQLWPVGLRNEERRWFTRNLTAGELRGGTWRVEGAMPAGPESLRLTAFTGSAEAVNATIHWLRPVPPITGVSGAASFSATEVVIRTRGGRQAAGEQASQRPARATSATAPRGNGLEAREGTVRFFEFDTAPGRVDIDAQLAGPLAEVMALVRHPRLKLFETRPLEIGAAAGQAEARLRVGFALYDDLPFEAVRLRVAGQVTDGRITKVLMGRDLERAALDVVVETDGLKITGRGVLEDAPLSLSYETDFRAGPPSQVTERAQLAVPRADARQLAIFGLDTAGTMSGPVALDARYERRRNGQGTVALRGDLRQARLTLEPAGWSKAAGVEGAVAATLRLNGEQLTAVEGLELDAPGLSLRGRIALQAGNRVERIDLSAGSRIGATRFSGEISRPRRSGAPWSVGLRGPVLDLQPVLRGDHAGAGPDGERAVPESRDSGAGPSFALDLSFDRVTMGEGRDLRGVRGQAQTDAQGMLREGRLSGSTGQGRDDGQGGFELSLTSQGRERKLRLQAGDAGALLYALDVTDAFQGGRLAVNASYAELRPGAPLSGTAELDQFVVRNAPAFAKVLQAMTLYGLVEAVQGGSGLMFQRMVLPFTLSRETLTIRDARAFSASLGLTAKGQVHRRRDQIEIEGTVVPAYVFNQLLGNIPLVGRLFSPERGGGVFAATFRARGPLSDPQVSVNPMAALTPGFLRGLFQLGQTGQAPPIPGER